MAFLPQHLDPSRHVLNIDSGEPSLDEWLRGHAVGANARRVSRTFVLVDSTQDEDAALGYYTLSGSLLDRESLPRSTGHGGPDQVAAVLLARLAVDKSLQGTGVGGELLFDAFEKIISATAVIAARFVVVDALSASAAKFYEHFGFSRIPGTPRLVQKISSIVESFDHL